MSKTGKDALTNYFLLKHVSLICIPCFPYPSSRMMDVGVGQAGNDIHVLSSYILVVMNNSLVI